MILTESESVKYNMDDKITAIKELLSAIKSNDLTRLQHILKTGKIPLKCWDDSGHTALGIAVINGFIQAAKIMIEAGALVDEEDFYSQTPLLHAADKGHLDMIRMLIKHGANVNWADGNNYGLSAMHLATLNGNADVVQELITAKSDVNARDINGVSVLHCAVGNGHRDVVELLLKARVNVNDRGLKSGRTPVFVAAEVGDMEILNMLIRANARVNIANDFGMTPLCAVCVQNDTHIALRLLQAGAGSKVNTADDKGSIPLHYAARSGNTELMEALIEKGSELDTMDTFYESPLHQAVRNCHVNAVDLLVKHGCDVNIGDSQGMGTALHLAVNSFSNSCDFSKLLETLIIGSCDLNHGAFTAMETPLFRALHREKIEFAALLLQHGADPNVDCPFDITMFQKVCQKKWIGLIELLIHCDLDWNREKWLDIDIHTSGINPKLLEGYVEHVPMELISDTNLYIKILQARCNTRRLVDMCHWTIRKHLSNKLHIKLRQTQLPLRLQDFVLLKIL